MTYASQNVNLFLLRCELLLRNALLPNVYRIADVNPSGNVFCGEPGEILCYEYVYF